MIVFTVLGNGFIIYVIYRNQYMHSSHNYMLAAVAASGLFTGLATQPLSVTAILQELTRDVNCDLKEAQAAIQLYGNLINLLTLMLFSLERILAVKFPFMYHVLVTPKLLFSLFVGIWLLTLLLVLSPYYTALAHASRMRVGVVFQMISFAAIVIICLIMFRMARQHENQIAAQLPVPNQVQHIQQQERKAFKTTLLVLGTLVLCQIPLFFSSFLFRIKVFDQQAFATALWPAGVLMHMTPSLNFWIYGWRNVEIRKKAMERLLGRGQNNEQAFFIAAQSSVRTNAACVSANV